MKNNILVIEHASSSISAQLKCDKIEYNNQSKDEDIHRWLISNKAILSTAQKIIIPVRLGTEDAEYMGLRVGLHIRLTRELEDIRLLPILFITDDSKEEILSNQINKHKEKSAILLFTKGSYLLSAFSLDEYISRTLLKIEETTLLEKVIPSFSIENTKDPGHQLANDWGAFRLAKFAGYTLKLEKPTSLYFKFKDSFTNNEIVPNRSSMDGTLKTSCKALLIDDNAKSGWSDVLGHILRKHIIRYDYSSDLDVIDTYDAALEFVDYSKYDLIFLDLRLLKEEDKGNIVMELEEFSGTKILRKIKECNRGIQVMVFSASNKIWYIDRLLNLKDASANGYYVKESPEYILSSNFSSENYNNLVENIKKCLDLKFLKDFYNEFDLIKVELLKRRQKDLPKEFVDEVIKWLEISNALIAKGATTLNITTSFLFYFSVIESISNKIIDVDNPIFVETENGQKKYNFQFRGSEQKLKNYIEDIPNSGIYRKTKGKLKSSRNIPWLLKILNAFDFISNYDIDEILVSNLIKKRNDIIHSNPTTGDKINIELRELIMLYKFIIEGLKNIK
jgi:hypothetical protein